MFSLYEESSCGAPSLKGVGVVPHLSSSSFLVRLAPAEHSASALCLPDVDPHEPVWLGSAQITVVRKSAQTAI